MQLTPKKKLYLSILGLCGVALLVDRTILGPDELSATESLDELTVPTSHVPSVETTAPSSAADPSVLWAIARQVESIAASENLDYETVPDAFGAPQSWFPEPTEVETPVVSGPSAPKLFRESHRLQAVMASGERGYAVVDGEGLFVGQVLDGFTLVSVGERSAEFEAENGDRVELVLEDESR